MIFKSTNIIIFKKFKKNTGFTLVELLVSVFIISLISGLFMVNYRQADQGAKLMNASQKLVSDMRLAQSYTLGLQKFEGSFPPGGWGIRLASGASSYVIFADNNEDHDYNAGEEHAIIDLPDNITINSITNFIGVSKLFLDIVFLPPDPTVYFNGASAINDVSADIVLRNNQTNLTKTITVNFLGMVDVAN